MKLEELESTGRGEGSASMAGSEKVAAEHLAEATRYRVLDRTLRLQT